MKQKIRKIYIAIGLIMVFFTLAQVKPNTSLSDITGKVITVDIRNGCVENLFNDGTITKIIEPKLSNEPYNAVVIKGESNYYLLSIHNDKVIDSDGNPYRFQKGDIVCYDNFPKATEVFT